MKNINKINLRVFRRNDESIDLLWDRDRLPLEKFKDRISIWIQKDETNEVYLADDIFFKSGAEKNIDTDMLVIPHKSNSLNKNEPCHIIFTLDDEEKLAIYKVCPVGVLPEYEKDDKSKNVHLMGWDKKDNYWKKIYLDDNSLKIKVDGLNEILNELKEIKKILKKND